VALERRLDGVEGGEALPGRPGLAGQLADDLGGDALGGQRDRLGLRRREGIVGEPLDMRPRQMPGLGDVLDEPAATRPADLGRGHVARKQSLRALLGRVDDPLEAGVDRGEQVAQAPDPPRLVGDQLAPAGDQQPDLGVELARRLDRPTSIPTTTSIALLSARRVLRSLPLPTLPYVAIDRGA
jgi:hypothetical protein